MYKSRKAQHSEIILPAVLAIGFTGHRALPDEAKCREWIYTFLTEKKAAHAGIVYGVSSAAAGADLLFAESCIQLGIPLRVLLPCPEEDFRRDFDAAAWARAEAVMQKAISVEVTGDPAFRDQRYYECGIETVQRSQMLVAIWDGEPSRGLGGTEEIVSFAKQMGRPVVWFHSATGNVEIFNGHGIDKLTHNPELAFLNQLPDGAVTLSTDSPTDIAKAWFEKIDTNASRLAPQVRRLASIPIVCTATAALASAAAARGQLAGGAGAAIGAALGLAAAALPAMLKLWQRQTLWARTRTATEVCRSVLALWDTPGTYQVLGPEIVPELGGMLMSLNVLKAMKNDSPVVMAPEEFRDRYIRERVSDQMKYFAKHADRSARESKRFGVVSRICAGSAIAISAWMFVGETLLRDPHLVPHKRLFQLAASALFQIATVAGALLIVNDCDRRQRRYRELHDSLKEWDKELKALKTWPPILQVAVRIEKALLAEILEWKSLIRNRKMPRN